MFHNLNKSLTDRKLRGFQLRHTEDFWLVDFYQEIDFDTGIVVNYCQLVD